MMPSEGGGGDGGRWGATGLDSPVGSVESDGMEAVWSSEEEERARAEGAGGGGGCGEAARWQRQGRTRSETRAAEVLSLLALVVQMYKY